MLLASLGDEWCINAVANNATRSLTQGERDLLLDLKTKLNGGKENEPADNLFVVCNFMDLVRTEKGREQVLSSARYANAPLRFI